MTLARERWALYDAFIAQPEPSMPVHAYPTTFHADAAAAIVEFFAARDESGAVLLVNSCARGKAMPDSDLDMVVLVPSGTAIDGLQVDWERFRTSDRRIAAFLAFGPFAVLHLDIEEAVIALPDHPEDEYPDWFELVIGNWLAWGAALWERDGFHARLRAEWLPFYDDALRRKRLGEVRRQCEDYLRFVPSYVARELYFQAFSRLWRGFQLFLQALFLSRRTYPIAYDKWIHEQVVDVLGLPDLYLQLPGLFEIGRFESDEVVEKSVQLQRLLDEYVPVAD